MNTRIVLLVALLIASAASAGETSKPSPEQVLDGVRDFFAKSANADGSFRPGIDPKYGGLSDSAYSDLAPTTYAVILHRTFGWTLPDEAKTRDFLLARQ